jgi:glutathione peroxidase
MSEFRQFSTRTLGGEEVSLEKFAGKLVLVVNTASKCGFTPQYAGLENLYRKYSKQGLVILGFPCNQFGNQEPGNTSSIQGGCLLNYGVTFPMFEKIEVKGGMPTRFWSG